MEKEEGGVNSLYHGIQVLCSAEPTHFDIAPFSMQVITEHPAFRSLTAGL